jgi:hypothetical protein
MNATWYKESYATQGNPRFQMISPLYHARLARLGFSVRPLASPKKNAYYVTWVQARAATMRNIFSHDPADTRAQGLKLKRRMTKHAEH